MRVTDPSRHPTSTKWVSGSNPGRDRAGGHRRYHRTLNSGWGSNPARHPVARKWSNGPRRRGRASAIGNAPRRRAGAARGTGSAADRVAVRDPAAAAPPRPQPTRAADRVRSVGPTMPVEGRFVDDGRAAGVVEDSDVAPAPIELASRAHRPGVADRRPAGRGRRPPRGTPAASSANHAARLGGHVAGTPRPTTTESAKRFRSLVMRPCVLPVPVQRFGHGEDRAAVEGDLDEQAASPRARRRAPRETRRRARRLIGARACRRHRARSGRARWRTVLPRKAMTPPSSALLVDHLEGARDGISAGRERRGDQRCAVLGRRKVVIVEEGDEVAVRRPRRRCVPRRGTGSVAAARSTAAPSPPWTTRRGPPAITRPCCRRPPRSPRGWGGSAARSNAPPGRRGGADRGG